MGKRKSTKGLLIKGILENIPSNVLGVLAPKIKELLGNYSGIYALYNNDELYFIG